MTDDDRRHAQAALVTLRTRVDEHFAGVVAREGTQLTCRVGCDACCAPGLSVFGVEATTIAAALAAMAHENPALREVVRNQGIDADTRDRCPLLVAGRCSVYEARPIICRSHGLAVREPDGEIRSCELNFVAAPPASAGVLELDALNRPLAVMAHMFDGGRRVSLAALARADDDDAAST